MEVGSIWSHGSYVAPDWLHREVVFILENWAQSEYSSTFKDLDEERQAQLIARLTKLLRTNTESILKKMFDGMKSGMAWGFLVGRICEVFVCLDSKPCNFRRS